MAILLKGMKQLALLRAVNVSGKNIIKMEQLRQTLRDAGFRNVSTYIQSGNIIFDKRGSATKAEKQIEDIIRNSFGHDVRAIVLDEQQLSDILKKNPYFADGADIKQLYVAFLTEAPSAENVDKLMQASFAPDEAMLTGRAVYLRYRNSAAGTKLSNALLENKLKVGSTSRNWNTCNRLLELLRVK